MNVIQTHLNVLLLLFLVQLADRTLHYNKRSFFVILIASGFFEPLA